MKYKVLVAVIAIVTLVGAYYIQGFSIKSYRYHQHLEEKSYIACQHHDDAVFCTHLPLLNIVTDAPILEPFLKDEVGNYYLGDNGRIIHNDEAVSGELTLYYGDSGNNHLTDTPAVSEKIIIRVRGSSSRLFDKKSYLVKFEENGVKKKVSLAGMPAESEWALHGPFLDKTLIRNYLCYNLAGEYMEYVPEVRFCEIFLNGTYQGVYLITEKIEHSKYGRCKINATDPERTETPFILQVDHRSPDDAYNLRTFFDYNGARGTARRINEYTTVRYPKTTLTDKQRDYIRDYVSSMEKALSSYDYTNRRRGYSAYLDVDSFVDYYVLSQFTLNADAGHKSTYYYKDSRGKLSIIGWDYNNTFDNYMPYSHQEDDIIYMSEWFECLLRDKWFVNKVVNRYRQLRKTYFSDAYLEAYIADTVEYLGPAIDRNFEKWGYSFDRDFCDSHPNQSLAPIDRNPKNYEKAVEQLEKSIKSRGAYLDQHIEALYSRCHESVTKQYRYEGNKNR